MKKAIPQLTLAGAILCACAPWSRAAPVLVATVGDLPELVYHIGQQSAKSELEKAQAAAETINTWPGWMAAAVMARTTAGDRVQIFCIFRRPGGASIGYLTPAAYALFPGWYPWSTVIRNAAPWSEEAYWLLQGGGRSDVIYKQGDPK